MSFGVISNLNKDVEVAARKAMENERNLRFNEELVRTAKRQILDKTLKKLGNRRLAVGMGRWKDICNMKYSQEDKFLRAAMRLRKRTLRQAIDQYKDWVNWHKQHCRNIRGAR